MVSRKRMYAQSLRNLEDISESIHAKRRLKMPREPGVGAELMSIPSSIDLEHDLMSLQSGASSDAKDLCAELSAEITDLNKK